MVSAPYTLPGDHPVIPILSELRLSHSQLESIMAKLISELELGLAEEGDERIPMLPAFIGQIPSGDEKGNVLTVDFGGTNVRVGLITLKGNGKFETEAVKSPIPDHLRSGSDGATVFGWIADQVVSYVKKHHCDPKKLKLAFTFSYATRQTALNAGTLVRWSKISVPDVVGKDPVKFLNEALKKRGLDIHVAALVNDTVSTLIGGAYTNPHTKAGLILGTGCNVAYIERSSAIPKFKDYAMNMEDKVKSSDIHVINTEWANFDRAKSVLPQTIYDKRQDEATTNKGYNLFEKLISGQYMGEVVRMIVAEAWEAGKLGEGPISEELKTPNAFQSKYMDQIERDETSSLDTISQLFTSTFKLNQPSLQDRFIIRSIVQQVATRSARLCGTALSAIFKLYCNHNPEVKNEPFHIAADGSVIGIYWRYRERVMAAIRELLGDQADRVAVNITPDASAHGVAIVALM